MIGARDNADALCEAGRSIDGVPVLEQLEVWNGTAYQAARQWEEQAGVKAIVALQKIAGIAETETKARSGWRAMDEHAREQTMLAYARLCGGS